jgi:hypothetical protein
MAQHDLGGSCTAQRYCHSEARISGQVKDEQGGSSAKRAVMIELTFCMRKRQSSYSHRVLSTLAGDCAIVCAMLLSTGTVPLEPAGCVSEWWRALRCSVSWNAESICPSCQPGCLVECTMLAHTSDKSTSGGPSAMSSALVPGRIRRSAAWSRLLNSFCCSGDADTGDSWSSGMGGGLGRRGEAGDVIVGQE